MVPSQHPISFSDLGGSSEISLQHLEVIQTLLLGILLGSVIHGLKSLAAV